MEKEFFPPFLGDSSMTDRSPRMDRIPEEGIVGGDHHDHGGKGCGCGISPIQGNGNCGGGCSHPAPQACGGCVGYEGCGHDSWGLCEYPLAMVYAPCQMFRGLHDPATALSRGTLFTELDLPLGREGCGTVALSCVCGRERRQS